jgi:glyoxylase-like metal-dependent hydrolase (beta-lactamase superfamily II)
MRRLSLFALLAVVLAVVLAVPLRVQAQAKPFGDGFLEELRRAATFIPGSPPQQVRVASVGHDGVRVSTMIEGAASDTVYLTYPVYQLRFEHGWITVDAAAPDSNFGPKVHWPTARWDSMQVALRDARLSVVTHEHWDHVMGIMRSQFFEAIRPHAMFTRAQAASMWKLVARNNLGAGIDSAEAARVLVVDVDPYMPIAPGVVLIRAAGHTPGSQMVYIRLAPGKEIILAGDAAWNMAGIREQRPNSVASKKALGVVEDDAASARQVRWLKQVMDTGVEVLVAHDYQWLEQLIARGIVVRGLDLRNP